MLVKNSSSDLCVNCKNTMHCYYKTNSTRPVIFCEVFIMADPNQIKQVVTNLTINAIQAMENGGKIIFTVKEVADKAVFSVDDTGIGISSEHISSAFVPFFTTKDVNEGTGSGLSVAYGIIKNHDGDIRVSSELQKGSMFEISLPLEKG